VSGSQCNSAAARASAPASEWLCPASHDGRGESPCGSAVTVSRLLPPRASDSVPARRRAASGGASDSTASVFSITSSARRHGPLLRAGAGITGIMMTLAPAIIPCRPRAGRGPRVGDARAVKASPARGSWRQAAWRPWPDSLAMGLPWMSSAGGHESVAARARDLAREALALHCRGCWPLLSRLYLLSRH
jgi:hypothetical protein